VTDLFDLLGNEAENLLQHECKGIPKDLLQVPGPDFVDRVFSLTDRSPVVMRNLQLMFNSGRLAGTGYLSILPVDQGVEHSAGASFAPNPIYFDPDRIVELAIEGGCSAVASTLGVLASVSRRYAHRIPFLVKLNHNELLTYPGIGRSDSVCLGGPGVRSRGGCSWHHDLFRFRGIPAADRGGQRGIRARP
jgi:fructose-bisphosphate aldolase, class I